MSTEIHGRKITSCLKQTSLEFLSFIFDTKLNNAKHNRLLCRILSVEINGKFEGVMRTWFLKRGTVGGVWGQKNIEKYTFS